MTSKTSLERKPLDMATLQIAFGGYCKIWGLRKSTAITLSLMMSSEELMLCILNFMVEIEESGQLEDMSLEERTSMLVEVATDLRNVWDRLQSKNSTL